MLPLCLPPATCANQHRQVRFTCPELLPVAGHAPGIRSLTTPRLTVVTSQKKQKSDNFIQKFLAVAGKIKQDAFSIGSFISAYHVRQCWCGYKEEGDNHKSQGDFSFDRALIPF